MNTGQMLLSVGALVLLGTTVLTVNRSYTQQGVILEQTEVGVYAISLATSMIEEASGTAFDQATYNSSVTTTTALTSPSSLGPESGETTTPATSANFNDFDDYNNLKMGVKIANVDSFTLSAKVYYIDPSMPETRSSTATFFKRMDVQVYGTTTADTIKMSYIFSYFIFR